MRPVNLLIAGTLLALPFGSGTSGRAAQVLVYTSIEQSDQQLVGTWEGDGPSDSRAQQHVVLELRRDYTYTKTLDAAVDGHHYGGTHSGTWKAEGSKVSLSGDGNWPPYLQNLSLMRKIR